MRFSYFFKHLSGAQKEFIKEYVEKKALQSVRLLGDAEYLVEVKAEQFATKHAYRIEFIASAPHVRFIASEDDHTLQEAIDLAWEKILHQARKAHSKKLRKGKGREEKTEER